MSIESEIKELEIEQRKYNRYGTKWRKIEDKKNELKRKRRRDEDEEEDDDGDIATLAAVGILDLGDSGNSYSDSPSSVDFGGGDSGGGGFGGDF